MTANKAISQTLVTVVKYVLYAVMLISLGFVGHAIWYGLKFGWQAFEIVFGVS